MSGGNVLFDPLGQAGNRDRVPCVEGVVFCPCHPAALGEDGPVLSRHAVGVAGQFIEQERHCPLQSFERALKHDFKGCRQSAVGNGVAGEELRVVETRIVCLEKSRDAVTGFLHRTNHSDLLTAM